MNVKIIESIVMALKDLYIGKSNGFPSLISSRPHRCLLKASLLFYFKKKTYPFM